MLEPRQKPPLREASGGIVATIFSGLRRHPNLGDCEQQLVTLADGGTISLSWWAASSGEPLAKCLVLPGLNCSSHWALVQHLVAQLCRLGFMVAVIDYRGMITPLTSSTLFGADSWRDLEEVVAVVAQRAPAALPVAAVGQSMGGTMLAKYLSHVGAACPLVAAATISSPLDISAHQRRLEEGLSWRAANCMTASIARLQMYRLWLTDASSRQYLTAVDWSALRRATSLRELEAATICRCNGYADPEDYYAYAQPEISRIATPLLCIHARDDPLIGFNELPFAAIAANPWVDLQGTMSGGHLGYHAGPSGVSSADLAASRFLAHRLQRWRQQQPQQRRQQQPSAPRAGPADAVLGAPPGPRARL